MRDKYEIRQQVHTIHKSWLEVIASGTTERAVRGEYNRYVRDYPEHYFELVRIENHEHCLAYTPKQDTLSAGAGDAWVSVEDRLPEDDERVLVCGNTGFGGAMQRGLAWFKRSTGEFDYPGVTHWQSFPPTPEEEAALRARD